VFVRAETKQVAFEFPEHAVPIAVARCLLIGAALALLTGCGNNSKTVIHERTVTATRPQTQATTSTPTANSSASVIEVQRGIGDANLGESEAAVRQTLGAPLRSIVVSKDAPPRTQFDFTNLTYPDQLTVGFPRGGNMSGRVTLASVNGTGARTPEGIGVGSSEADVRARIAGITCDTRFGQHACYVGQYKQGTVVTLFRLHGDRVTEVEVELLGAVDRPHGPFAGRDPKCPHCD
jgi:hypothetical protein